MKKKHKNHTGNKDGRPFTQQEFDAWIGRLGSVVHEGQQQLGAGCVMQTNDTLTYVTTKEFAILATELAPALADLLASCTPNQFVVMVAGDSAGAMGIIDAPAPLAELHRQWAKTLEATR